VKKGWEKLSQVSTRSLHKFHYKQQLNFHKKWKT
jgi:hypothetical protein